jgi:hypothetical protein
MSSRVNLVIEEAEANDGPTACFSIFAAGFAVGYGVREMISVSATAFAKGVITRPTMIDLSIFGV